MFGFGRRPIVHIELLEHDIKYCINAIEHLSKDISSLRMDIIQIERDKDIIERDQSRLKDRIKNLELIEEVNRIAKGREYHILPIVGPLDPQNLAQDMREDYRLIGYELSGVVGEKRQELWVKKDMQCK